MLFCFTAYFFFLEVATAAASETAESISALSFMPVIGLLLSPSLPVPVSLSLLSPPSPTPLGFAVVVVVLLLSSPSLSTPVVTTVTGCVSVGVSVG